MKFILFFLIISEKIVWAEIQNQMDSNSLTIKIAQGDREKKFEFLKDQLLIYENKKLLVTLDYKIEDFKYIQDKVEKLKKTQASFTSIKDCHRDYIQIQLNNNNAMGACLGTPKSVAYLELVSGF